LRGHQRRKPGHDCRNSTQTNPVFRSHSIIPSVYWGLPLAQRLVCGRNRLRRFARMNSGSSTRRLSDGQTTAVKLALSSAVVSFANGPAVPSLPSSRRVPCRPITRRRTWPWNRDPPASNGCRKSPAEPACCLHPLNPPPFVASTWIAAFVHAAALCVTDIGLWSESGRSRSGAVSVGSRRLTQAEPPLPFVLDTGLPKRYNRPGFWQGGGGVEENMCFCETKPNFSRAVLHLSIWATDT
jgi:hypothetical protein